MQGAATLLVQAEDSRHVSSLTPLITPYPELKEQPRGLGAKGVILTHLGPEMLQNLKAVEEKCAYDGLENEI